jgi:hypothetical protein
MKRYAILTINNLTKLQEQVLSYLPINMMVEETKSKDARVISYLHNTTDILNNVPLLKEYLSNFNLTHNDVLIGINVAQPYYKSPIHLDPLDFALYSINIPICHCENTFLHFYKSMVENEKANFGNSKHQLNFTRYSPKDCIHIETVNTSEPYILNMTTPHQFDNSNNNKPRYMLLCRVKRNCDKGVENFLI